MPDSPSHVFTLQLAHDGTKTTISAQTPFTIGRAPEMDLVLPYPFISRRQAEIRFDDLTERLELTASGAACFVNGKRVERHALAAGDEIRFGSMEGPLLRLLGEAASTQAGTMSLRAALDHLERPANAGAAELGKLAWFVDAARRLNGVGGLHEILAALIDTTLELTGVERGYVFLKNAAGELNLVEGRGAGGEALEDSSTLSRTAIQQAIQGGQEFIVTDTLSAEAAAPSESMVLQSIRAILCIPLRRRGGEAEVLGVLYLDSRLQKSELTRLDSELLRTIAVEAALLVENAALAEEELAARRYREELRIASEIQQSLMSVRVPQLSYAEVEANSIPCKGIGGDFYDVLCHGDALYVVVADVSGKGVSAAVLGSTLQGLIHGQILSGLTLPEIALFANRYICHKDVRKYATMVLLRLTEDGAAEYINCGHVQPLLHAPDGSLTRPENCNLPVGLFPDAVYESERLQLKPGQRLFCLTDGVTEAEDPSAAEFGAGPLQSLVAGGAALEEIFTQVARFTAGNPLQDDCTLVEVRYRP